MRIAARPGTCSTCPPLVGGAVSRRRVRATGRQRLLGAACGGLKPPTAGRLRRAKPSSPAQHHVEKLYLQTELLSTFVAHVGSQTTWPNLDRDGHCLANWPSP